MCSPVFLRTSGSGDLSISSYPKLFTPFPQKYVIKNTFIHSRQYRWPDAFSDLNQTVLVVGAAVRMTSYLFISFLLIQGRTNGVEISRDIIGNVRLGIRFHPNISTSCQQASRYRVTFRYWYLRVTLYQ